MKKGFFWLLWLVAFAAGAYGVYQRLAFGHDLAGYTSYVPWGLWVAGYIYFIGLSAGAFLLSTLVYVFGLKAFARIGKLALFTALVTLIAALLTIWFDIGHMERFWKVFTRPNFGSMMAWMVWLYTAYFLLLVAELWIALRGDLAQWSDRPGLAGGLARFLSFGQRDVGAAALKRDAARLKVLGSIGVPLAVAFHGGVGALFAVVEARPYWNSSLLPIMFLVSALLSGSALLTFLVSFFWPKGQDGAVKELVSNLGRIVLGLLTFDVILEISEFLVGLYSTAPAHRGVFLEVAAGQASWLFWGVTVVLGALVPAVLLLTGRNSPGTVGTAALLIALSFLALRFNIVVPGLTTSPLPGLANAYIEARLSFHYLPTTMEWLVLLFNGSLAVLLLAIGFNYLPLTTASKEV